MDELEKLRQELGGARARARVRALAHPKRELSLVITKIEEALLWLTQVEAYEGPETAEVKDRR